MAISPTAFDYELDTPETDVARKLTLRQARLRKLWSMNRLASEAKVAASTIMRIEEMRPGDEPADATGAKGERRLGPRLSTIERLSRALGMDPTEIAWPFDPLGEGPDDDT